ncbi:MAG: CDP-alcohol phosphatidyltransferase family protein [Coriobacteriales bacterium]|nr:CDP-alcohol phosphatidyltransferase family protein [Coriobacteriales bacterium]
MKAPPPDPAPRSMLWFARDLPNLCSLAGLACAVLGVYFAILGVFPAAMVGLVWAVVFDWLDGRVARRIPGRTAEEREFGAHLDSLIDVVSFAVAPALLLLSVGGFSPWFLPGAIVCLAAGTVRLSYFNTFGLVDDSTYRGLALDNNVLLLVAVFAFQPLLSAFAFSALLYATLMLLAVLNVSPIRTPKLSGRWYYAVVAYALAASALYGWRLLAV